MKKFLTCIVDKTHIPCYNCRAKGVWIMYRRRPVREIVDKIRELIKEKNYGALSLANKIQSLGISEDVNRGRIERAFYSGQSKLSYIASLDETIEAVLTVFGLTNEDLYNMLLDNPPEIKFDLGDEMLEFVNNPEAVPFLKNALTQYKIHKAEQEIEKLRKELNK